MDGVVLYGIGSPIVVDFEESLARGGLTLAAGVRNFPGPSYLLDSSRLVDASAMGNHFLGLPYLVPLFTPGHRQQAVAEARSLGFLYPFSLVDPSVARPRALQNGPGLYVNAGCSLGAASKFGEFVLINRGATVGHHADLGPFVSVGPGAVLAGSVSIGRGSVIGAGAVILPQITIGANAVVGAGAVVTKDVVAHCMVLGNPARVVKTDITGYQGKRVA